ncbi:tail fiber domain-containing protein [Clostridium acetobutylicum]|uniref:tail fiber domain-containing protein n=1 Tax=Clostridium acetobutylicum TaxID=1488 RepID=UPI0017ED9D45|nr:tail fiber domain-containing protein [Clostridium acetobutylicum]NYC94154.1 hypothetical protein [Clostridium acetobutylicum]
MCGTLILVFKYAIADSTENALDIINRFKHRQFHWKEDGRHQELGYVSQELYAINPALVLSVPQKTDSHYATKRRYDYPLFK